VKHVVLEGRRRSFRIGDSLPTRARGESGFALCRGKTSRIATIVVRRRCDHSPFSGMRITDELPKDIPVFFTACHPSLNFRDGLNARRRFPKCS
jgi:hypothetical protein